jgi:hypothetical protein
VIRRWQQLISAYVALCFALAGVIGLNPALHVGMEHGGQGALHLHLGGNGRVVGAHHAHPHPHEWESFSPPASQTSRLATGASLTLFGLEPQDIYRAVGCWLARMTESLPATPQPDEPGHTHHSLAQLLLGGFVEGTIEIEPPVVAPEPCSLFGPVPESVTVAGEFYSPTAGRGPPVFC